MMAAAVSVSRCCSQCMCRSATARMPWKQECEHGILLWERPRSPGDVASAERQPAQQSLHSNRRRPTWGEAIGSCNAEAQQARDGRTVLEWTRGGPAQWLPRARVCACVCTRVHVSIVSWSSTPIHPTPTLPCTHFQAHRWVVLSAMSHMSHSHPTVYLQNLFTLPNWNSCHRETPSPLLPHPPAPGAPCSPVSPDLTPLGPS